MVRTVARGSFFRGVREDKNDFGTSVLFVVAMLFLRCALSYPTFSPWGHVPTSALKKVHNIFKSQ